MPPKASPEAQPSSSRRPRSSSRSPSGNSRSRSGSRPGRRKGPRREKSPVDVTNRFIPWDGTIPDNPSQKHWLFRSRDRPLIKSPFGENDNDTEPDPPPFPYHYPQKVDNRPSHFLKVYNPLDAYNDYCGTVVIPRRDDQADLTALISMTNNPIQPPMGVETLAARFLVCSRTMHTSIPDFKAQFDRQAGLAECQRLGPHSADVYGVFLWKLPKVNITALWILLTIVHHRWPLHWTRMDIPIETLFELAKLINIVGIKPDSTAWIQIKQRLDYTLGRQRSEVGRPTDQNIGKWLYIAKTFKWEEDFAAIWANLIVSTWRFTIESEGVDRYSGGRDGDPTPDVPFKWWYTVDDLGEDMKQTLLNDRYIMVYDLRHLWARFRSKHRLPLQSKATIEEIMIAIGNWDASAQDLRDAIIKYANEITEQQKRLALISNHQLNPLVLADCNRLINDVNVLFNQVRSRDVEDNRVLVDQADYWRPLAYDNPFIETPLELDPETGSKNTIFMFQSGPETTSNTGEKREKVERAYTD
ncbi:hypothetical protein ABW20_dc0106584 [Dactylellina cionopaga]|nr:hypothetical protein ABW20_dc0106584 [Dactylellina cionopaga]